MVAFLSFGMTVSVCVDDPSAVCQQESSLNMFDLYHKEILKQVKRCRQLALCWCQFVRLKFHRRHHGDMRDIDHTNGCSFFSNDKLSTATDNLSCE